MTRSYTSLNKFKRDGMPVLHVAAARQTTACSPTFTRLFGVTMACPWSTGCGDSIAKLSSVLKITSSGLRSTPAKEKGPAQQHEPEAERFARIALVQVASTCHRDVLQVCSAAVAAAGKVDAHAMSI